MTSWSPSSNFRYEFYNSGANAASVLCGLLDLCARLGEVLDRLEGAVRLDHGQEHLI